MTVQVEEKKIIRFSSCEREVLQVFRCRLAVEGVTEFTSDLFRTWGFDKILYGDPQHATGLFFFKLVKLNIAKEINDHYEWIGDFL